MPVLESRPGTFPEFKESRYPSYDYLIPAEDDEGDLKLSDVFDYLIIILVTAILLLLIR